MTSPRFAPTPARRCLLALCALLSVASGSVFAAEPSAPKTSSSKAPTAGRLVIAGGAIRDNRDAIMKAMIAGEKPVSVLATASGVATEVGPEIVADFEKVSKKGQARVIDITTSTSARASEKEYVTKIAESGGIWFSGGDQNRILSVFRPAAGDTPGYQAMVDVLNGGGVIGGTSAGAACQSDPMIGGGSSDAAMETGVTASVGESDERGVIITRGMGFFPYGLVDQHFLRRGRIGRLIVAMDYTNNKFGWGVEENSALLADLKTGELGVIGDPGVLQVALEKVSGRNYTVRLSLMHEGDKSNGKTGVFQSGEGRKALDVKTTATVEQRTNLFADKGLTSAIADIGTGKVGRIEFTGKAYSAVLMADGKTKFTQAKDGAPRVGCSDLVLTIDRSASPRREGGQR